ncbi:venom serine carboxypeptidase-like [Macrosteles quadrilineatus]|uniref:venom serine carboxypeptidase-like n=1 Tax=Macrosteles quadrilineatus TaxID=74068 RepID=UPI0023E0FE7F|nr:venom serine carboxypeptidase-like [Macrosteles quadrilineatus]
MFRKLLILSFTIGLSVVTCVSNEVLILTSLIESGKIAEAQQKSRVSPDINGVKSYTGFLTVDKDCGNNLFFWFFPAEVNWENAPVLLWLTGGPGTSSCYGLFAEVGPFRWKNNTKELIENKNRWTKDFNVIFLDQPVGTGFSYTERNCYAKTNKEIAKQVYSALVQFFHLFPNLRKNSFSLVGDSYAGTYQTAIGREIDERNCDSKVKINLKGVLLGNPYLDLSCLSYASNWYEAGFIEEDSRDRIVKYQGIRNKYIQEKNSEKANEYENKIWNEEFSQIGLPSMFNYLYDEEITMGFKHFVTDEKTRKLLKVGNTKYNVTSYFGTVAKVLEPELIVSAIPNVKYLLDKNYLVAFYTGQLDVQCIYSSLNCVLDQLNHAEYQKAKRKKWYVDGRLAGWVRQGSNLMSVVVRDAGHVVPVDQGEAALALAKGCLGSDKLDLQK